MSALNAHNISRITPAPSPAIVNVTPEMAEAWLAGNTVNRKIRIDAVNQYASDMLSGRWSLSADAICFSPDGLLLNGQHRLNAVIAADVTVPMLVLRNVPVEAMSNMDTGRKRSAADDLGFHGESNTAALASALKVAILYCDGRIYKDRKLQSVSNGELREFLSENEDLRDSLMAVYHGYKTIDLTPTAKIVGHWLMSRAASPAEADIFFGLLASRVGLPEGSPILALDSRLRELRRTRTYLNHREELTLLVKTWNYWRAGRSVRTLAAKSKGSDTRIPAVAR
jgi:hypothetical protein